jgi:hypothetical protein
MARYFLRLAIQKNSKAANRRIAIPPTTPPTIAPVLDFAVLDDWPLDVDPSAVVPPEIDPVGVELPPEVEPFVPPADVLDPVGNVPPLEVVPVDAPPPEVPEVDVPRQRSDMSDLRLNFFRISYRFEQ